MGILNFRTVMGHLIKEVKLEQLLLLAPNTPVNVYFDGSLYMYRGCIPSALNSKKIYNSRLVAENTHNKILNIIKFFVNSKVEINKVYIYFDGNRPTLKTHTSEKRQNKNEIEVEDQIKKVAQINRIQVQNYLAEYINKYTNIEMQNLIVGEGEHEAFIRRDRTIPSIICTDDSDIYHIAYNYIPDNYNDYVFLCSTNLEFRNLNELYNNIKIPTLAFRLLLMLKGSDFTRNIFTPTMIQGILKAFQHQSDSTISSYVDKITTICDKYQKREISCNEINKVNKANILNNINCFDISPVAIANIYTLEHVYTILRYFLLILLNQEIYTKITWNIQRQGYYDSSINNLHNELKSLYWAVNYSLIGSGFEEYSNTDFTYTLNFSPFSFFTIILKNTYKEYTNIYKTEECKKIKQNFLMNYIEFKRNRSFFAKKYKNA